MRIAFVIALLVVIAIVVLSNIDFSGLSLWVINQQRAFQNGMASALWSLRSGEVSAYLALFAATGGYGFIHALGPGHGKYLVGGVGLGSSVSTLKLVGLAIVSSVLQAVWAIVLVFGGFTLLEVSAERLTYLSESILAPVSYVAIGLIGLILAWRGMRLLAHRSRSSNHALSHSSENHDHDHDHDCGHSHGPSPDDVAKVGSLREAALLVASIAVRPCTGAVFLLVIAWQMDIKIAGAAAVFVMGLGTALLTSLVAASSVAARRLAFFSAQASGVTSIVFPAAQIVAGTLIVWFSIGLLFIVL